jgi:hypothetical protein
VTNTGGISGILSTTQTLTDIQETDLFAGQTYTNVHSSSFPGGEIRAQLNPTTDGQTNYFTGTLQGSQEVPANASAGTGTVTTVLDRATGFVYVTGNFSGLSGTVTASHIHVAPPGTNGSVVLGLTPTTSVTTGSTTGSGAMTPTNQTQMLAGNSYINVHTTAFPGGEIRAQLGSIALPAKLVYFNGFRNNEEATLVWKTSQELDFSRFEIQRLLPGNVWSTRGAVTANGGASEYRFNDKPNGNNTIAIYRLKMIDKDGEASFSRIITISFGKQTALLSIVENPVKNSVLQFQVTGLKSQESLTVKIMDINGRIVHNETTSSINMNTISIHELSAGVYKLVVHTRDGLLQKTFIKL